MRQQRAITAIDAIVNQLDDLRVEHELSKADLARAIDKNPAAVRRLLTARGNPELATVVAMADALDADIAVVPRKKRRPRRTATLAGLRHLTLRLASACPRGGLASRAA